MPGIVGIRVNNQARSARYLVEDLELYVGDKVIVEKNGDRRMGIVGISRRPILKGENVSELGWVLRIADEEDLDLGRQNDQDEKEAFTYCRDLIDQHKLEMSLVAAEFTYDERKLIFYFTADGRVDFRDLVRDLAAHFHMRIELRQIGVRDDARMNGGLGICGRELCCSMWMDEFVPVSIRMAKEQNISMNPTKVSGACGRLLCCLNYENEAYKANRKLMPKLGATLELDGVEYKVIAQNILSLELTVKPIDRDGNLGDPVTLPAESFGWGELRRKPEVSREAEAGREPGMTRGSEVARGAEATRGVEVLRGAESQRDAGLQRDTQLKRESGLQRESGLSRDTGLPPEHAGDQAEETECTQKAKGEVQTEAAPKAEGGAQTEATEMAEPVLEKKADACATSEVNEASYTEISQSDGTQDPDESDSTLASQPGASVFQEYDSPNADSTTKSDCCTAGACSRNQCACPKAAEVNLEDSVVVAYATSEGEIAVPGLEESGAEN